MLTNLYLFNYNNYYNRIVKKEDTLAGYGSPVLSLMSTSFNPNDGVMTKHIFNLADSIHPDYVVEADTNGNILSRWFITEQARTRSGQYEITLKRDVVADNYDTVINAPCFIEKATLNEDDPMIFNNEDMTYNQIKQSETLLKDETNSAWIVGYLASNALYDSETETTRDITITTKPKINDTNRVNAVDYINKTFIKINKIEIKMNMRLTTYYPNNIQQDKQLLGNQYRIVYDNNTGVFTANPSPIISPNRQTRSDTTFYYSKGENRQIFTGYEAATLINADILTGEISGWEDAIHGNNGIEKIIFNVGQDGFYSSTLGDFVNTKTQTEIEEDILPLDSKYDIIDGVRKTIKVSSGEVQVPIDSTDYASISVALGNIADLLNKGWNEDGLDTATAPKGYFGLDIYGSYYRVTAEEYNPQTLTFTIPSTARRLYDAPYIMFAIPYNNFSFSYKSPSGSTFQTIQCLGGDSINIAYGITDELQAGEFVYDLQLLPYCPLREFITNSESGRIIKIEDSETVRNVSLVYRAGDTQHNDPLGAVFYCPSSEFTFNIQHSIPIENKKISNEVDVYRLNSPNYSGTFEFSPAKNDGVSFFNVDCRYKPYTPYIHINPNFKNLYGNDFNDARGLVCQGDFSLPIINDQWKQFEINNKNYQNSFDRTIQNMSIKNTWGIVSSVTGAIAGTAQGAVVGAEAGAKSGGGAKGSILGAIVGGVTSLAGGIVDTIQTVQLQKEEKSYATDQFNYSMGNIQALPYTLGNVGAYNNNNKIFPFIEYYTCTEQERQALIDKLKYNGMTVMRIGTINEFIRDELSFIRGKLIRITDISDDFHMLTAIAEEINKGVFI